MQRSNLYKVTTRVGDAFHTFYVVADDHVDAQEKISREGYTEEFVTVESLFPVNT